MSLIRQIQQVVSQGQSNTGFGVPSVVPFHKHTGLDSPKISYTNLTNIPAPVSSGTKVYVGKVTSGVAGTPFPSGWSVSNAVTGSYTVTHNLGSTKYGLVATSIGTVSIPSINTISSNSFIIFWYSTAANLQNTDFDFMLSFG